MTIDKFSKKQLRILAEAVDKKNNYLICDGSVRSGKTVTMLIGFIMWAMTNYYRKNFALCSKTISVAERNLIKPLQELEQLGICTKYSSTKGLLTVTDGRITNYFYVFGGKDESSYSLVQGITLQGALLDEVALMPRSFVEQVMSRTLTNKEAKIWFNCNPESPNHWFYKEWILEPKDKCKHLHFTMEDNPIMDDEAISRAEGMYSGVFYDRYIKGLWVNCEGAIYTSYINNPKRHCINPEDIPRLRTINVGVDFGGNKSNHAIVATGIDEGFRNLYVLKANSYIATGTDVNFIINKLDSFCDDIVADFGAIDRVYCDSAEQAIINTIRANSRYGHLVCNSIKNPIIDRIRATDALFAQGRLKMCIEDTEALDEGLKGAVWDDKKKDDTRLDNGTSDIDVLDAFEYSFERYLSALINYRG